MDANDTRADLHLSKRFFNATEWAAARHAASTDGELESRPSLGQVLGIAAMLLDAIGSDVARLAEVRSTFGKKTAKLVALCAHSSRTFAGREASRLPASARQQTSSSTVIGCSSRC